MIQHFLGLCPDHATHLNIFDAMLTTGALAFAGPYVMRIKSIFWRKPSGPTTESSDSHVHSAACNHEHKH